MCVAIASLIVTGSFAGNYFQRQNYNSLFSNHQNLQTQLLAFDSENSKLNQTIAAREDKLNQILSFHQTQVELISHELVEIERLTGVDTGDDNFTLEERIQIIGEFYNAKEQQYTVIDSRVEQIEGVIGLDHEVDEESDLDIASRVELASLTASQERILHDSIPSGYPTKALKITSGFGKRKHPVTKVNSFHKGVDIRARTGDKIFATADGFVANTDYSELSGNRIVVLHNFGFETRYSHLDKMLVAPGDVVHKGGLIGLSGNTGRSSAPHLHYEIRYLGKATDPHEFLKWEFGTNEIFTQVRGIKWPSLISLINKQITHQTLQLSLLDPGSQVK